LYKTKRSKPDVLSKAEQHVESWRNSLLEKVHQRIDIATFMLVSTACGIIGNSAQRLMPRQPSRVEMLTRDLLFGLQFTLSGLKGDLPAGPFIEELIADSLGENDWKRSAAALKCMSDYYKVRDAFLTYAWGGYEIETRGSSLIRFVDAPTWIGKRDHAQHVINQEIKLEQVISNTSSLVLSPQVLIERALDVPATLTLRELTAAQFVSTWIGLTSKFFPAWLTGQTLVVETTTVLALVQGLGNLSVAEAETFVNLVIYDRQADLPLNLFFCPLVPLTQSSLLVVTPGFIMGNPLVSVVRLAVHRGAGLDVYAKDLAAQFQEKLRRHFEGPGVTIQTNITYSNQDDTGDIDFVLYETASNRLILAQIKGFIFPDTVEEVYRANEALEKGVEQAERVRRWWNSRGSSQWPQILNMPASSTLPEVHFVVIGNGFSGSDYLEIPGYIRVVDAQYLLLSKFRRRSIFEPIAEYERRISEESGQAEKDLSFAPIQLGDIIFEIPAWSI
jgi:hypothetical protein